MKSRMDGQTAHSSNQSFGFFFSALFLLLSGYLWYQGTEKSIIYAWVTSSTCIVLLIVTIFSPNILTPFNKAWLRLGELLGKIFSPIVLGIIFFVLITPVALITRLFGRDELRLKKQSLDSHWIKRDPPGPSNDSFDKQF